MGRPPKPTRLRLLEGNPGRRPINENEPKPRQRRRLPSPPDSLGDEGKKEWRRLGPALMKLGLLTDLDLNAFTLFCSTWERWLVASCEARRIPLVLTPRNFLVQSPWVSISNRLFYMLNQSLARFGMDPASLSRIAVDPTDKDDDDLSKFLFGGGA